MQSVKKRHSRVRRGNSQSGRWACVVSLRRTTCNKYRRRVQRTEGQRAPESVEVGYSIAVCPSAFMLYGNGRWTHLLLSLCSTSACSRMIQRNCGVVFHVSLLYNLVLEHEQRRPWWSRIEPHLALGALPLQAKDHLNLLVQREGVKAVVTMNQPEELLPNFLSTPVSPAEWAKEHVAQCFGSTRDFASPALDTLEKCVLFLHDQVDVQHNTTYVHCKAGRGRSAVVVVAFLMQYRHMTLDEAFEAVATKRPHVCLNTSQYQTLREFSDKCSSPGAPRPALPTRNDVSRTPDQR